MALDFQYLEIDGVEFDTHWQNGGYKKISDIIFAECHIFIVSNLCLYCMQCCRHVLSQCVYERHSPPENIQNGESLRIMA
jgi:hypothetical protein